MMPNKMKKRVSCICYILGIVFLSFGVWYLVFNNDETSDYSILNSNLEKSLSIDVLTNTQNAIFKKEIEPVFYADVYEAIENAKYYPTSFKGKLTHYGPDCALCGGTLGCNRQPALNGNIYYTDKEYGTLRIVAATKLIPCGSIIRINVDAYDPNGMYVIVLDRGVSPGIIDLLKEYETAKSPVATVNNVVFDIVRYGY